MTAPLLAEWASSLDVDAVPPSVQHAAKRHMLDAVGNAVAARRHGLGEAAWQVGHSFGTAGEARPLTGDARLAAPAAALVTGVLVHALDFDDTHGGALVHPTAVVLPAALSVGQQTDATGAEVVAAVAVGLEVACRIGAAVPHGFHERGIHATAAVGPLAAAVAAGRLMGLDAGELVDAMGVAGSSSGGLLEFLETGADTKTLHPGMASMNGIVAARLAQAGATGPASVLEGRRGLFAAMTDAKPDLEGLASGLGSHWEAEHIGIKPYPNCQLMHVTLDAVAEAVRGEPIAPGDIESVEVRVHPDSMAIVCGEHTGRAAPRTVYDAKFDLPWSVAALLHDGAVTVDTYSSSSIGRPDVARTGSRIVTVPEAMIVPAADAPGRAIVRAVDGRETVGVVAGSRGTAAHPLTDTEVRAKFVHNCGGHRDAAALADAVVDLTEADSLAPLLEQSARVLD